MKEITAIIRRDRLHETKQVLDELDIPLSVSRASTEGENSGGRSATTTSIRNCLTNIARQLN